MAEQLGVGLEKSSQILKLKKKEEKRTLFLRRIELRQNVNLKMNSVVCIFWEESDVHHGRKSFMGLCVQKQNLPHLKRANFKEFNRK